jgi:uroporphyrinogen decarboxylase
MNLKEKILASINQEETSWAPVEPGATTSFGISDIAYSNLLKYIGREDLLVLI